MFKHFWQLYDLFQVNYRIHANVDTPLLQEDSNPTMETSNETEIDIYTTQEWIRLNRVKKFNYNKSIDAMLCDDRMIDPSMLPGQPGDSRCDFLTEKPMPSNS